MVQPWWALGVAVPAIIVKSAVTGKSKAKAKEEGFDASRAENSSDPSFLCERVCTSDRLLRRMGDLSKNPTRHTCVTVCGVSAVDSCTEACQRSVCANMHQVPAWNDACLKRCTTECTRGRAI